MELSELGLNWEEFARHDPLWAILTDDQRRRGRWDPEEFFATGVREINRLLGKLAELGLAPAKGDALDFGCGVGRLTQALAAHFDRSVGIDISPTMIELATKANRHGERCRYVVNASDRLPGFADASLDLIYSNIVLQHIQRAYVESYLAEFLRVLRPGGALVFLMPSALHRPRHAWRHAFVGIKRLLVRAGVSGLLWKLRLLRSPAIMEIHTFPKPELERFLAERGGEVVLAELVDAAHPVEAYWYYARKTS